MNEVVIRRRVAETTQKLVKGSTDPALTLKNFAEVLDALGDLMSEWTEEHKCCAEDLMALRSSEQTGWKEAAIAWEVRASIHEKFAKGKDALYSTRHADFEKHAEDARRKLTPNA